MIGWRARVFGDWGVFAPATAMEAGVWGGEAAAWHARAFTSVYLKPLLARGSG
jgi:hypothetical protein